VLTEQQPLAQQLSSLFALDPEQLHDPYPLYRRLREESPVHLAGPVAIVSRHREAKSVYRDHERFPPPDTRGAPFEDQLSLLSDEEVAMFREITAFERTFLNRMHGETHRRVRSAAQRAFTPKRVEELRASVRRLTDSLLDELAAADEPDVIAFAYRLPLLVVMDLLGAPHEDAEMVKAWGDAVVSNSSVSPLPRELVRRSYADISDYREWARELIAHHRRAGDPTHLVTLLLDATQEDRLTEEELVGMYMLLLLGGHETTANLIGNGTYALLAHPEQWERLRSQPELAASAVEEFLRYDSPVQFFGKVAACDVDLAGVDVPAGTYMMIGNAAANHDPAVFAEPERLDIGRRPNDHLSLGYGLHFCLGAGVARLEGQIAFEALARRFPDLEPAVELDRIALRDHYSLRGRVSLPVRLGADRGSTSTA
jgi:cytochrome P450